MRAMLHGTRSGKPMHGPLKDIPEKAIIQRYKEGRSIKALAAEFNVSPNTIRKRLELRGVQIRSWKL
jgi:DNA-directed RNA polymerase specialized sigma24 family protein